MSNAATRIGHISIPPGNDVEMKMWDRLSCRRSFVEADIKTVSPVQFGDNGPGFLNGRYNRQLLSCVKIRPGGDMAVRRDQQVTSADRETIPNGFQ